MAIKKAQLRKLPDAPGVYFFKKGRRILYIGKATSLKERVRSYLSGDLWTARGERIVRMVAEATEISFQKTDSVLEALLLEAALIKKHQPFYNVDEKSDRSFNYVVITDEPMPRVLTMRERELLTRPPKARSTFGPFPHAGQLRDALKIVRHIFPYFGKTDAPKKGRRPSRLYEEIGLAPKESNGGVKNYRRTIRHLELFFAGKKQVLEKSLLREIRTLSKQRAFEDAAELTRRLRALRHINDVALIRREREVPVSPVAFRVEGYDVAHLHETNRVGVMVVLVDGEPRRGDYRMFTVRTEGGGDTAALAEILDRRFAHDEWRFPSAIVVDGGVAQLRTAKRALDRLGVSIPVVAVTKDEFHRPQRIQGDAVLAHTHERDILLVNSEAHRFALSFQRKKRLRNSRR